MAFHVAAHFHSVEGDTSDGSEHDCEDEEVPEDSGGDLACLSR